MAVFFTSDLHLGHANIIKLCNRPFANVEEMHRAIWERWNSTVETIDDVIVLGDVAFGPVTRHRDFISSLNGRKFLVPGNHDAAWGGHRRKERAKNKRQEYIDAGFADVLPDIMEWELTGFGKVRLSHLPSAGDSQEEPRFEEHRPKFDGRPIICGHVHEAWRIGGLNINIGVDVTNFTPVHELDVAQIAHKIMESRANAPAHHPLIGARVVR